MASNTSGVNSVSNLFGNSPQMSNYVQPVMYQGAIDVDYEGIKPAAPVSAPRRKSTVKPTGVKQLQAERASAAPEVAAPPTPAPAAGAGSAAKTTAEVAQSALDFEKEQTVNHNRAQMAMSGANFLVDVMNANNAYNSAAGQARMGIMMARNQANDAIYRGRQAQADAQFEGYQQGQDSTLAMAAQGQDVQGAGVNKVQGSFEAMGVYNGMREEINSMREALGFQLEEVQYEYQLKEAKIGRDVAIWGSGLSNATRAGAAAAGGI